MTVRFESEALEEYREAALFSQRRFGLGGEFAEAVEAALATIVSDPRRFRHIGDGVRLFLMPRFPYSIYFHHDADRGLVIIYAVCHHSRQPGYWRDRLPDT